MEHRWGTRVPLDLEVRLRCKPDAVGFGVLRDASMSGGYIESALRLPILGQVYLELDLDLPERHGTYKVPAYIVRSDPHGFAVEWYTLAPVCISELLLNRLAAHSSGTLSHPAYSVSA